MSKKQTVLSYYYDKPKIYKFNRCDCLNSAYRAGFADSKKTNSGAIEFAINQCQTPSYYVPPVN